MRTVYLIHGFNTKDGGAHTTDLLAPLFQNVGFRVRELDYGYFQRVRVRMCNDAVARMVANTLEPGSIVVAHSNGCDIVYRAAKHGAVFARAVLINPALDKDKSIDNAGSVHVWYSPSDGWTSASRLLPWSNWGNQGQVGYVGGDPRYRQFNEDTMFNATVGHSGVFKYSYMRHSIFRHSIEGFENE